MKRFIVAVALTAALASPALARETRASAYAPTRSYVQEDAAWTARAQVLPQGRYLAAPANQVGIHTPYDIYVAGEYVGADPDPNVRLNMIEDYFHRQ